MEKQLFEEVTQHIKGSVPEFRWIDANEGQLNSTERPPLAYPSCLIEMSYSSCRELGGGEQQITVEFRLTCVFDAIGGTINAHAPTEVRQLALQRYDILQKLHKTLQWWTGEGLWMPMRRVRVSPTLRRDGLKVYECIYQLEYIDSL